MITEKEKKALLRKEIKGLLNKYNSPLIEAKSKLIQHHLFSIPEYENPRLIMFYVSIDREVYTHDMIRIALNEKKKIAVPLILKSQNIMLPCEINDWKDLKPGSWSIPQPDKEKIQVVPVKKLDLIIVPGVAFDRSGNRLGRGKGFYDKFLHLIGPKTIKIALAFSCQVIERIPTTENDFAVDKIITEDGVIECKTRHKGTEGQSYNIKE